MLGTLNEFLAGHFLLFTFFVLGVIFVQSGIFIVNMSMILKLYHFEPVLKHEIHLPNLKIRKTIHFYLYCMMILMSIIAVVLFSFRSEFYSEFIGPVDLSYDGDEVIPSRRSIFLNNEFYDEFNVYRRKIFSVASLGFFGDFASISHEAFEATNDLSGFLNDPNDFIHHKVKMSLSSDRLQQLSSQNGPQGIGETFDVSLGGHNFLLLADTFSTGDKCIRKIHSLSPAANNDEDVFYYELSFWVREAKPSVVAEDDTSPVTKKYFFECSKRYEFQVAIKLTVVCFILIYLLIFIVIYRVQSFHLAIHSCLSYDNNIKKFVTLFDPEQEDNLLFQENEQRRMTIIMESSDDDDIRRRRRRRKKKKKKRRYEEEEEEIEPRKMKRIDDVIQETRDCGEFLKSQFRRHPDTNENNIKRFEYFLKNNNRSRCELRVTRNWMFCSLYEDVQRSQERGVLKYLDFCYIGPKSELVSSTTPIDVERKTCFLKSISDKYSKTSINFFFSDRRISSNSKDCSYFFEKCCVVGGVVHEEKRNSKKKMITLNLLYNEQKKNQQHPRRRLYDHEFFNLLFTFHPEAKEKIREARETHEDLRTEMARLGRAAYFTRNQSYSIPSTITTLFPQTEETRRFEETEEDENIGLFEEEEEEEEETNTRRTEDCLSELEALIRSLFDCSSGVLSFSELKKNRRRVEIRNLLNRISVSNNNNNNEEEETEHAEQQLENKKKRFLQKKECLICFEEERVHIMFGDCNHSICIDCVLQISRNKCPFCRKEIDPKKMRVVSKWNFSKLFL